MLLYSGILYEDIILCILCSFYIFVMPWMAIFQFSCLEKRLNESVIVYLLHIYLTLLYQYQSSPCMELDLL